LPHGSTDGLETPRGACRTGDVRKLHPTSTDNGTLMLVCEYFPKRGSQKRNKRYMNPTNHGIFWVIWGWNPMFLGSWVLLLMLLSPFWLVFYPSFVALFHGI
jgi:hypothetical protein